MMPSGEALLGEKPASSILDAEHKTLGLLLCGEREAKLSLACHVDWTSWHVRGGRERGPLSSPVSVHKSTATDHKTCLLSTRPRGILG